MGRWGYPTSWGTIWGVVLGTAAQRAVVRRQPLVSLGREWRLAYLLCLPVVLVIFGLIAFFLS